MNDLKRLVDRLEELADPPGGRAAEDILNAAAGGSATATEGGPNRRRSSALLVTAAIVLVAGFVSLHVWDGDDTRLVTTPAGPTEASPSSASADEGSTASSAGLDIERRLAEFKPDIPAREVPLAQPLADDEPGLSDDGSPT